jgi:hypothetical protein
MLRLDDSPARWRRIVIRREQAGYFHSRKRDRRGSKPPTCPRPMPTGQCSWHDYIIFFNSWVKWLFATPCVQIQKHGQDKDDAFDHLLVIG